MLKCAIDAFCLFSLLRVSRHRHYIHVPALFPYMLTDLFLAKLTHFVTSLRNEKFGETRHINQILNMNGNIELSTHLDYIYFLIEINTSTANKIKTENSACARNVRAAWLQPLCVLDRCASCPSARCKLYLFSVFSRCIAFFGPFFWFLLFTIFRSFFLRFECAESFLFHLLFRFIFSRYMCFLLLFLARVPHTHSLARTSHHGT